MSRSPARLTIPLVLAATAIAVASGCPSDDSNEPNTTTLSGDTDGPLPDCDAIEDETACGDAEGCIWFPDLEICIVECDIIEDEATCEDQGFCFWDENRCILGGI